MVEDMLVTSKIINKMDGVFQSLSVGEFYYPNGEKYEGDWKNDMRNGRGTLSRTPR